MAQATEKGLDPSHPNISTKTRTFLWGALGIYSASCFVVAILAITASQIVRPGAFASKQWGSDRNRLMQAYNGNDTTLPWQFRFSNPADIGKTFDSAYASPSSADWIFVAGVALISLITTAIMFLKIGLPSKKLGQPFFEYIFHGVGLTVILFAPFLLICMKSLSVMTWLAKENAVYAELIRDTIAYTIFHV